MIETYESEGPKCPHCGRQYTADEPIYFDETRYTSEQCDDCGKVFDVEVQHETTWRCTIKAPSMTLDIPDGEGG